MEAGTASKVGDPDPKRDYETQPRIQEVCCPGQRGGVQVRTSVPVSCCLKGSYVIVSQKRPEPRDTAEP